jgi:uncharacterized delta-60 repeat protein
MGRSVIADGSSTRAAVVNEHEVRAAAGLTMAIGAVAFGYAYFAKQYIPLQAAASLFLAEFLIRVTAGLRYSPIGVVARAMTLGRAPEWVSTKPKRFAWTLGLAMALAMTVITNSGTRGPLPRTMCLICLTLMWMESALGLCLGCKIYGLLLRRGWIGANPDIEVCADGSCARSSEPTKRVGVGASSSFSASGVPGAALAVVGVLLVFASSAAAAAPRPIGPPLRRWSVSEIDQGVGKVVAAHGTQRSGALVKVIDLGFAAFDFPFSPVASDAAGSVTTTADGSSSDALAQAPSLDPFDPRSAKGGVAHLDQFQAFEIPPKHAKPAVGASLQITIKSLKLDTIDANGPLTPSECPVVGTAPCSSIRTIARFQVHAYPVAGGHDFFNSGGVVFMEGHEHDWNVGAATLPDSRVPFFPDAQFKRETDVDRNGTGRRAHLGILIGHAITLKVPLRSLSGGELFMLHVSLDAQAIDDRGRESAAEAYIRDPQHAGARLSARGLIARAVPTVKEPPIQPRPAARCPAGPRPHAGSLQLSAPAFTVGEGSDTPLVLVTRAGGSRGAASVIVKTSGGSARSGQDFTPTKTLVRFENGDTSPRLVEIPIREDLTAESPESFTVSLANVRCAKLGKQRAATVTILDDDQPPPPPAPTFTIGGTVDGLQGSGLVLSTVGSAPLPVSANGSFTFPGTASDGQSYEVKVATQPHNPDQVCTVQNGAGQIARANVSNIAVHCALLATPSGLDTTFGSGGRVTTPGDGDGEAVLIQPDGRIVTVGPRQVPATFHFQFGATRHDAAGNLDPSFGTGGVVTTSLGGNDDKAFDAAMFPDGGFVTVGQADPSGLGNTDFGIVRYTPDGQPEPTFGTGGKLVSDLFGRDDGANAVAVQPDGKIIVAGFATTSPANFDFALVRYNPDGTLDHSFGGDGIVTTDIGTLHEGITDIALQPDGKITAIGATDQDAVLARYNPDGTLDLTFGNSGTVLGGIGTNEVNGVAITPAGTILVAGSRGGPTGGLDPIVASYAPNGKLNLGFGQGGVAQADLSGGTDSGDDLVVKPNGDIVVVGSALSATVTDMALIRFKPDGTLDTFLTADFTGFGEFGHALAIDSQGRIVAAGSASGFALMRAFL